MTRSWNAGEANPNAKLTEEAVEDMLEAVLSGEMSRKGAARYFGVAWTTAQNIFSGKSWAHVRPDIERSML